MLCIKVILWRVCNIDPTTRPAEYVEILLEWGFDVKVEYVRSIFRSWRWSWKRPSRFQLEKYTEENMERYINFLLWIREVPWGKLKFLDEGEFLFPFFIFLFLSHSISFSFSFLHWFTSHLNRHFDLFYILFASFPIHSILHYILCYFTFYIDFLLLIYY